jgi:hypothetical protein
MKTIKLKDLNVTTGGFGWGGFYRAEALASAINGYPPPVAPAPYYGYGYPVGPVGYGGWGGWGGGRGFRR